MAGTLKSTDEILRGSTYNEDPRAPRKFDSPKQQQHMSSSGLYGLEWVNADRDPAMPALVDAPETRAQWWDKLTKAPRVDQQLASLQRLQAAEEADAARWTATKAALRSPPGGPDPYAQYRRY